ncbi:MAG: undecaprenyl-diphosphate phosphatase [Candidatus Hodarchaeales archaeon]|jgi:undecaprenyl-diphosphatase
MLEFEILGIILGILQGLFEWLPISSEGQLVIILAQFWEINFVDATTLAFFAHIGTALVVFIYYRKDYYSMIRACYLWIINRVKPENQLEIDQRSLNLFILVLLVSIFTLPTALLSLLIVEDLILSLNQSLGFNLSEIITLMVGIFLILTGITLYYRTKFADSLSGVTKFEDLPISHAIILGLLQGFTAIPGISRSGITITYLLIGSKLDQNESLRASFIVGAPVTLGAGFLQVLRGKIMFVSTGITNQSDIIIMNYLGAILMIISAFIIGALTLKTFLEAAKKVRFDYFLVIFGIIAVLAVLIGFLLF